jgi:ABC-type phosphate/phosphonate transport system substrate-binding protein
VGDVNAGGVRNKAYMKYKDKELKIIASSPRIREHPIISTGTLDAQTLSLIREALLGIREPGDVERLLKPIKSTLTALVRVEDKDYDQLRDIISTVRQDELRGKNQGNRGQ